MADGTAALPNLRVSAVNEAGYVYRDAGGLASLARRAATVFLNPQWPAGQRPALDLSRAASPDFRFTQLSWLLPPARPVEQQ
jgi:hypothetical protein